MEGYINDSLTSTSATVTISTLTAKTVRKSKANTISAITSSKQNEIREGMLKQAAAMYADVIKGIGDKKKVPQSTFAQIMATFGNLVWMDRNNIYHQYRKTVLQSHNTESDVLIENSNPPPETIVFSDNDKAEMEHVSALTENSNRNKGGRPPLVLSADEIALHNKKSNYRIHENKKRMSRKIIEWSNYGRNILQYQTSWLTC
jgi:DNA-binding transcriptional regulator YiaG